MHYLNQLDRFLLHADDQLIHSPDKVAVADKCRDGDAQASGRSNKRFRDTTGEVAGVANPGQLDLGKYLGLNDSMNRSFDT